MTIEIHADNISSLITSFDQLRENPSNGHVSFIKSRKINAINGVMGVWLNFGLATDIKIIHRSQDEPVHESATLILVVSDKYFSYQSSNNSYSTTTHIGLVIQQHNNVKIVLHKGVEYHLVCFSVSNDFLKTYFPNQLILPHSFALEEKSIKLTKGIARKNQVDSLFELASLTELFFTAISNLKVKRGFPVEIDYSKIELVKEHLHKNLRGHQPSLDNLEHIAGMSKSSLKAKFKKYEGVSVQEYFLREKMKLAVQLISDGTSIKETALKLGYSSTSGFSTAFRKVIGISPSQFISKN